MTLLDLISKLKSSEEQLIRVQEAYSGKRVEDNLISNLKASINSTKQLIKQYGRGIILKVSGDCYAEPNRITKIGFTIYYTDTLQAEVTSLLKIDIPSFIPQSIKTEHVITRKIYYAPK